MEARRRPLVGAIGPAVGGGAAAAPSLMQALFGRVPLTACVRTGFFVVGALGFIRRYPLTQPTVLSAAFAPASSFGFPHPNL